MMTRASRLLKWIGAGTVVLAVAPIAYADAARHTATPSSGAFSTSSTAPRSTSPGSTPGGTLDSTHCDAGLVDFAGGYTVVGRDGVAVDLRADGGVSEFYLGAPAATGTWWVNGDELVWTAGGVTYTSVSHSAACADPAHASRITSVTVTPSGGTAGATGTAGTTGSLGSDPLTLQRR